MTEPQHPNPNPFGAMPGQPASREHPHHQPPHAMPPGSPASAQQYGKPPPMGAGPSPSGPSAPGAMPAQPPAPPASPQQQQPETARAAGDTEALAQAQAELATLKAKSSDLADQYLRAKAEADNARRRADDEVAKARKFAIESFAESLLPVLDSLEAGLAIKEATAQQIREGTDATLRQLTAALERNKVLPVDPKPGEKFDPNRHHAISVVPGAAAQPPNTIVGVLQKGYTIADRVLRPALVTVSAPE